VGDVTGDRLDRAPPSSLSPRDTVTVMVASTGDTGTATGNWPGA
jgi:hypothetical protein